MEGAVAHRTRYFVSLFCKASHFWWGCGSVHRVKHCTARADVNCSCNAGLHTLNYPRWTTLFAETSLTGVRSEWYNWLRDYAFFVKHLSRLRKQHFNAWSAHYWRQKWNIRRNVWHAVRHLPLWCQSYCILIKLFLSVFSAECTLLITLYPIIANSIAWPTSSLHFL